MATIIKMQSKLSNIISQNALLNNLTTVLFGSLLLGLAAQITIPLTPVPITLQAFAALFIGMIFGSKMGWKIVAAYLIEGACGLPVFANFSFGIPVLLGPTGGYLLGFIPAAIVTGYLLEHGWASHRLTIFLAALLGMITLFIPGYFVLAYFVGFHNAYLFGIAPFYLADSCKIILLTVSVPYFWKPLTK